MGVTLNVKISQEHFSAIQALQDAYHNHYSETQIIEDAIEALVETPENEGIGEFRNVGSGPTRDFIFVKGF